MRTSLQPLNLIAGPLALVFEPASAMLRYVRLGDAEVLRGVYVAVRDRNWDTIVPVVSNLAVDQQKDAFVIAFDVDCVRGEIEFGWQGLITGGRDGTLTYRTSGQARSTFLKNRIGFCVLHPIAECAGQPCAVRHVDGTVTEGSFPHEISPHQPFKRVRSIRHRVSDAVEAEVSFAGDVFEMEDQRNWTDASFKTYCTPLDLPFPEEIRAQDRVEQTVTLSLIGRRGNAGRAATGAPARTRDVPQVMFSGRRLPPLGLCVASHGQMPSARELERLAALNPSHLRVDINMKADKPFASLEIAAGQAAILNVPLDVAITLGPAPEEELRRLGEAMGLLQARVSHFLVFHQDEKSTSAEWVKLARARLAGVMGDVRFAGGTNAYFAELNRGRPDVAAMDAVVYSVNPQVHASDDASLVETLEAQGDTVRSARQFCGARPVCVGPITLRPRFNPNATAAAPPPSPGELPPEVDPRQCELFTAAWTLGSICELALAGGARLTYFETTGWRGVMETEEGPPLPERFPSVAGCVYPVYHVLADIGEFTGGEIASLDFRRPLEVRGAVLRTKAPHGGHRYRLLVANVANSIQQVKLPPLDGFEYAVFRCRTLDDRTLEVAVREPERFRERERFRESAAVEFAESTLELRPYAYMCLDVIADVRRDNSP